MDDDEVRACLDRPSRPSSLSLSSVLSRPSFRRSFAKKLCQYSVLFTLVPVLSQHRLACFKAALHPESGAWLNCVQKHRVGTLIATETLCIGVALASDSLSVLLIDANIGRRWTHSVRTLRRAASALGAFRLQRHRSTWPFCSRDTVNARNV